MKKIINSHQKSTIRKVMNYIRRYWGYLGMSIVLAAVTVALTLYLPVLTGRAVDLIIEKGVVDFTGILAILKKMAVIILLTAVAQWIMNACNNKITYNIIRDIRKEAFEKIEKLPLKYIDGHSYGEIVSRVIADVDQFADGLLMGFTQFFTGIVTILVELIKLANLIININKSIACGNRIQAIFELQPSITDNAMTPVAEKKAEHSSEVPEVVFSHVGLTYAGAGEESLTDIDFTVKKGETIGIIGGTGSGKSSVVNLIPRFYDATKGSVQIEGKDVREYSLEELREKIGMVLQKAVLFKGTIRENM